ncbi:MAG TPA: DUF502 domain-containing protein [Gammaproteobacteria bacterium]
MIKLRNFFFNIFIGGVLVLLPIIIILQILQWLFALFEESTRPLTFYLVSEFSLNQTLALITSLILVVILFSIIGMIVRTQVGNNLFQITERILLFKIPGYRTVKEITEQISGKQKGLFRKVALITVGNTGVSATGFVTDEIDENHSTVFIPCGPNPTTGFILHVNNKDITVLDVSVESAMKTVISCGSGSAKFIFGKEMQALETASASLNKSANKRE